MLADKFVKYKKKVAIIDFSGNKDLYEMHIFNEDVTEEALIDLLNDENKPYKLDNKVLLYTATPNSNFSMELNNIFKIINKVKENNDIVLIDIDRNELHKIYHLVDKLFIVIDQDLTNTKEFTSSISIQENLLALKTTNKFQFIINKYIFHKDLLDDRELVECYCHKIEDYNNVNMNTKLIKNINEILRLNFSEDIVISTYTSKFTNYNIEEIDSQISYICNKAYPLKKEKNKGMFLGRLFNKKR